jgi:hypothetical protein
MYMLVAIAVTVVVIVLAWRGIGGAGPTGRSVGDRDTPTPRPTARPAQPTRVIAPDDDPDFLHEIDRRMRGEDKSS